MTGRPEIKVGIIDGGFLFWHREFIEQNADPDYCNIWQNPGEDIGGVDGTLFWNDELDPPRWDYDPDDINNEDDDNNGAIDDLIGANFYHDQNGDPVGEPHEVDDVVENTDECFHGTPVAGIIAAKTNNDGWFAGVAGGWGEEQAGVKLVLVKMGDFVLQWEVAEALNYLINCVDVDIISMSIGFPPMDDIDSLLVNAVNEVEGSGILVVCSTGNGGGGVYYPANHSATLAVGASGNDQRAPYSCYGAELDIVAPSSYIDAEPPNEPPNEIHYNIVYSTGVVPDDELDLEIEADPNDALEACLFGGTSASAPQVAGTAALLQSQIYDENQPDMRLTVNQIKKIMFTTTNKDTEGLEILYPEDRKYGSWDPQMGYGELDAGRAVVYGNRLAVELDAGYTLISSNLEPYYTAENRLDGEEGFCLQFDEIADDIEKVRDNDNNLWVPNQYCDIPNWDFHQSYSTKLSSAATWTSVGKQIDYNEDIPVAEGWNLVAYFPTYGLEAPEAFVSLWDGEEVDVLIIAKDSWGCFYWPEYEYNGMGTLTPGYGYEIEVTEDYTLTYPNEEGDLDAFSGKRQNRIRSNPEHFKFTSRTGDFYTILLTSVSVEGLECEQDDEIGVFTANGLCIGATVYTGETYLGLSAWRDDNTTDEIDGYRVNETFYFRYWDADRDLVIGSDSLNIFSNTDAVGSNNGHSVHDLQIGDLSIMPGSFSLDQNYPNPFNSSTVISYSLPTISDVQLGVYDLEGRLVKIIVNEQQTAGYHKVAWKGTSSKDRAVPTGVYFYKIEAVTEHGSVYSATRKMSVIK